MRAKCPESGLTRRSRSPVKRGAPCQATAYPPTTRNSTFLAFNKEHRSAKSFWTSMPPCSSQRSHVLAPQALHLTDPFLMGTAEPVQESAVIALIPLKCAERQYP